MTDDQFKASVMKICQDSVWWGVFIQRVANGFALMFLLISIALSVRAGFLIMHDPFLGNFMLLPSAASIWAALNSRESGVRGLQKMLECRGDAMDGMWKILKE